jgi:hypothetical protein
VNYDIHKKFNLRTGISKINLSYKTNDIAFYPEIIGKGIETLSYSNEGATIVVHDNLIEPKAIQSKQSGSIQQQLDYFEIPLEISYKILDNKLGINFIGGMSSFILNNNEVTVISNDFSATLGKANNLNTVHFSTNVGVGFRYRFWKSFQANFEPTFKYQINTFSSNDGGFRPYFIGLYSGVSYRF